MDHMTGDHKHLLLGYGTISCMR